MFGLLKNKLSGFIKNLTGREEKKEPERQPELPVEIKEEIAQTPKSEPSPETTAPPVEEKPQVIVEEKKPAPVVHEKKIEHAPPPEKKAAHPVKHEVKTAPEPEKKTEQLIVEKKEIILPKDATEQAPVPPTQKKSILTSVFGALTGEKEQKKPIAETSPAKKPEIQKPAQAMPQVNKPEPTPVQQPKPQAPKTTTMSPPTPSAPQPDFSHLEKKSQSERKELAPKLGIGTTIRSFFSSEVTISESDVSDLLEELELSLLEADVAYDVSLAVTEQLRRELVGMKVPKGAVEEKTKQTVSGVLESVMDSDRKFDLITRLRGLPKPAKILFVGPNGAGKTTTMAKMARMLMDAGFSVVFSASDTFRAAAIEQTEVHGDKLGIKVIKSRYGADPSSVAFDAISYAKSHSLEVVLIDSAGRQDTNANLLSELKKINRVAAPDIKLYVGESIGGNSIIEQIKAFNEAIGLDGAILTKIDCDAKGGTAISVAKAAGIPVLFLGVGQGYHDLIPFDPHKIAQQIMN